MIRIPFSNVVPESRLVSVHSGVSDSSDYNAASEVDRVRLIEARVATMELKLATHAEEIQSQVTERVLRIQSRLERTLSLFDVTPDQEDVEATVPGAGNVVEFSSDGGDFHYLHAANAMEALLELNDTIRQTREHLEALASSVTRMKRAVASA